MFAAKLESANHGIVVIRGFQRGLSSYSELVIRLPLDEAAAAD